MSASTRLWLINGLAAAALLLGTAAWLFWPEPEPRVVELQADPQCDLRAGPCSLSAPDGTRVQFAIEPRDIPVGKTLQLTVDIDGAPAEAVAVDINGVDMDMGLRPYPLDSSDGRHFSGPGGLNFCSRGIMEWEARVKLRQGDRELVAPFRFITVAPDPARPASESSTANPSTLIPEKP